MVTRELTSVDVLERDDLDRLFDELPALRGLPVTLDIASEADVLNTAAEYEALAEAAKACGVRLAVATDDPLRQELALIYGLSVPSSPDAVTSVLRRDDARRQWSRPTLATPEIPDIELLGATIPAARPGDLLAPRGSAVVDSNASFSFVVAPPADRRPRFTDTADIRVPTRAGQRRKAANRSTGRAVSASAVVVACIVVAVSIAVLLIGLLAPSATVVLVPETRTISSELTYGVASAGQTLDVAIEPVTVSETLTFESSIEATGQREVPDAKARGMIFLTNPHTRSVELPAGTALTSLDGSLVFLTVETIVVPAADPFGAATFGTAVVDVEAADAGLEGNLDTGELSGELESGLLYQNRFPLEGGTVRTEQVVTQADLDHLESQSEEDLRSRVATALEEIVEPGWLMIGAPQANEAIEMAFTARPGDVAESVSVTAELRVDGQVYNPAALERRAEAELERRLGASTPEGFSFLLDSVRISEPAAAGSGIGYVIRGEATIRAFIDPSVEDSLADELTGKSEPAARRVLDQIDGLAGYQLTYGPEWLPWEPIPQFSNRISVDVDAS